MSVRGENTAATVGREQFGEGVHSTWLPDRHQDHRMRDHDERYTVRFKQQKTPRNTTESQRSLKRKSPRAVESKLSPFRTRRKGTSRAFRAEGFRPMRMPRMFEGSFNSRAMLEHVIARGDVSRRVLAQGDEKPRRCNTGSESGVRGIPRFQNELVPR